MFETRRTTSTLGSVLTTFELIYHNTVRHMRRGHSNALIGLAMDMMQTVILVLVFYMMFTVLEIRGNKIRGDFMLYIMSGIFLYMTHSRALSAIAGAEGPTSPMMHHRPMTTAIAIASAALSTLYSQMLSVVLLLVVYDLAMGPIQIHDPIGCLAMLLLSWFVGCAIGMCFLAIKPWFPTFTKVGSTVYTRANMLASGKMFVANTLPAKMLAIFSWNPLFHTIDQARGYAFVNYFPHFTDWRYALYVGLALLMIGMMGEFYTRRHASLSWNAGR